MWNISGSDLRSFDFQGWSERSETLQDNIRVTGEYLIFSSFLGNLKYLKVLWKWFKVECFSVVVKAIRYFAGSSQEFPVLGIVITIWAIWKAIGGNLTLWDLQGQSVPTRSGQGFSEILNFLDFITNLRYLRCI